MTQRAMYAIVTATLIVILVGVAPAKIVGAQDDAPISGLLVYSGEAADIYLLDLATQQVTQLTMGMPIDIHPMLSPDGQTVVFERSSVGESVIYLVDADGGNLRPLVEVGEAPSWSPDGSRIVYSVRVDSEDTIYVVDADGRNRERLLPPGENGYNPVWSPDGSQIAFIRNLNLFVMDADGSNVRPVYMNNAEMASCPAWSPDGQQIAFHNYADSRQIVLVDADRTNVRVLTDGPEDNCPTWSPDGQYIVFASVRDTGNIELYMIDVDGHNLVKLRDGYGHYPSWWLPADANNDAPDEGES